MLWSLTRQSSNHKQKGNWGEMSLDMSLKKLATCILAGLAVALAFSTDGLADPCSDVAAGGTMGPKPDYTGFPSGACYVTWPGGGGDPILRSKYEQQCRSLPGYLQFSGDYGSNQNTCVYSPRGESSAMQPPAQYNTAPIVRPPPPEYNAAPSVRPAPSTGNPFGASSPASTATNPFDGSASKSEQDDSNEVNPFSGATSHGPASAYGASNPFASQSPIPRCRSGNGPRDCVSFEQRGRSGRWHNFRLVNACNSQFSVNVFRCYADWAGGCIVEAQHLSPCETTESASAGNQSWDQDAQPRW